MYNLGILSEINASLSLPSGACLFLPGFCNCCHVFFFLKFISTFSQRKIHYLSPGPPARERPPRPPRAPGLAPPRGRRRTRRRSPGAAGRTGRGSGWGGTRRRRRRHSRSLGSPGWARGGGGTWAAEWGRRGGRPCASPAGLSVLICGKIW